MGGVLVHIKALNCTQSHVKLMVLYMYGIGMLGRTLHCIYNMHMFAKQQCGFAYSLCTIPCMQVVNLPWDSIHA